MITFLVCLSDRSTEDIPPVIIAKQGEKHVIKRKLTTTKTTFAILLSPSNDASVARDPLKKKRLAMNGREETGAQCCFSNHKSSQANHPLFAVVIYNYNYSYNLQSPTENRQGEWAPWLNIIIIIIIIIIVACCF